MVFKRHEREDKANEHIRRIPFQKHLKFKKVCVVKKNKGKENSFIVDKLE